MALSAKDQSILDSIVVASENDPLRPEFPADDPKFPATPTYQIKVPGFSNVWLKDESFNPTGTHKDRMAWEVVVTYRSFLLSMRQPNSTMTKLPAMSLISSGSAALAIQTQLRKYGLPNLRVLVDANLNPLVMRSLKKIGCEIYETDLSKKELSWQEILRLTHNEDGLDITSNQALEPNSRFYDWLSYEIINNNPEYCFIPFGTGQLYENILNINKREVSSKTHDPRFCGDTKVLRNCNFMGASSNNPNTRAEKLYSPHLPFSHFDEHWMRLYRQAGYCGPKSDVYPIREEFLEEAIQIAANQNLHAEPSALAGLALLLQIRDEIPPDAKILIVSTGETKYP